MPSFNEPLENRFFKHLNMGIILLVVEVEVLEE